MNHPIRSLCVLASLLAPGFPIAAAQEVVHETNSDDEGELFGSAIANMGDQDGDGREDFAVSVPGREILQGGHQGNEGVIEVRQGQSGALIGCIENPFSGGLFGGTLEVVSDADQDGFKDLLVSYSNLVTDTRRLMRFSLADSLLLDEVQLPPGMSLSRFRGFREIHDWDGDGTQDIAVAAEVPDPVTDYQSHVRILSGIDLSLLAILEPLGRHPSYGSYIEPLGDIDGDGVHDLAICAWFDDSVALRAGRIYFHSGATGAEIDSLIGTHAEERLGFVVEALPDVDGDGVADFAASSPYLLSDVDFGFVEVYSGATRTPLQRFTSNQLEDSFGWSVSAMDNVDYEEGIEIAIGAPGLLGPDTEPGRVEFFSIASGDLVGVQEGARPRQSFGLELARLADATGNSFDELVIAGSGLHFGGIVEGGVVAVEGPMSMSPPCSPAIPYCGQTAANSVGQLASIEQIGSAELQGSSFGIVIRDLPPQAPTLLLASLEVGFAPMPGGSLGNLCLGGSISRFVDQFQPASSTGALLFNPDLDAMPTPLGFVQATPSQVWHFQAWYRDVHAGGSSNFSAALSVDVCP